MNNLRSEVYLNRFPIYRLSETEKTVWVYTYIFNSSPEPGYADKMAKTIQRIGEVGILQNVDREKSFFA